MKASPVEQQDLLRLQALDTRLRQLAYKLTNLPQAAALTRLAAEDEEVRRRRMDVIGSLEDARAELARTESDASIVEARIVRDSERITQSSSVKNVAGLESELASLRKRLSDLEDIELAVMERVDEGEAALAAIDAERDALAADIARIQTEHTEYSESIDAERSHAERDRAALLVRIPVVLQTLYERQRATHDGIGAALLQARTCKGCTITLTGIDLDAVRRAAPDDVVRCPECDCILVRTELSGI